MNLQTDSQNDNLKENENDHQIKINNKRDYLHFFKKYKIRKMSWSINRRGIPL